MDKNYLNDIEKDAIIKFIENKTMLNAVKKVLLEEIYFMGRLEKDKDVEDRNWAYTLGGQTNDATMPDAELGSLLKATAKGLGALERGFDRLSEFKREVPEQKEEGNPAE